MAWHSGSKRRAAAGYSAGVVGLLVALTACGGGTAGDDPDFYRGQNIDLVVPYEPGGGYDSYARTMAPRIADCLGAQVVVRNEPGAGSLLATNTTAAAGPQALRLQLLNTTGTLSAQLADAEGVQFDMGEMSMIGRIATSADTIAVAADGDIESFEDLLEASDPVRFAATGPGSNEYITAQVLGEVYGFPFEVITGFDGSGAARLSVVAGDTDAHSSTWDSMLPVMEAGDVVPVVLADGERIEELPDVPAVGEYEPRDEEAQEILDAFIALGETGRSLIGPPDIPEDQLGALRDAFDCAMEDEGLLSDLENQQRPVDALGGAEYEEQVNDVLDATDEFREVLASAF